MYASCSGVLNEITYAVNIWTVSDRYEDWKWPVTLYELHPDPKFDFAREYMNDWFDKDILSSRCKWHRHTTVWSSTLDAVCHLGGLGSAENSRGLFNLWVWLRDLLVYSRGRFILQKFEIL